MQPSRTIRPLHFAFCTLHFALCTLQLCGPLAASAQDRPIHYFQSARHPPGSVGQAQLRRGGPLAGHFQPVKLLAPPGVHVAVASAGDFESEEPAPRLLSLQLGQVYTFKVTRIPTHMGAEVYPTVEIINRLYPPEGQDLRFPIPIEFTEDELEMALSGLYVLRVIYLEDPATALPQPQSGEHTRVEEISGEEDPLHAADRLGRPMAILRMGSRVPAGDGQHTFPYGTPPLLKHSTAELLPPTAGQPEQIQAAITREPRNIPRLPLPQPRPLSAPQWRTGR